MKKTTPFCWFIRASVVAGILLWFIGNQPDPKLPDMYYGMSEEEAHAAIEELHDRHWRWHQEQEAKKEDAWQAELSLEFGMWRNRVQLEQEERRAKAVHDAIVEAQHSSESPD